MQVSVWDSVAEIGYEQRTTFWMDFSIADEFGVGAISDTFQRAFDGWNDNVEYFTELTMILNRKCWYWYDKGNEKYSELYSHLFYVAKDWGMEHFTGDDLDYFWRTID